MKKFTVISLLLVLAAGFAFAGLVPYSKAGYSILSEGTKDDRLQGLTFLGNFVAGVVANDLVDINFNIDTELDDTKGKCEFAVDPSLNVAYSGEKLDAGVSFAFPFSYSDGEITNLDNLATYLDAFEVTTNVSYTNTLKNSENILTVDADAEFVFDESDLDAGFNVGATVEADKLTASAAGFFGFGSEAGVLKKDFFKSASASVEYDYKDVVFAANATVANYDLVALTLLEDDLYQYDVNGTALYSYEKAVGTALYDEYSVLARVGFDVNNISGKATTATAAAIVGLPHLIPVELVPNMSFNLPASINLGAEYAVEDAELAFKFAVTTHPVYIEFAKKLSVFDETIDSLDIALTYGNRGSYDLDFVNLEHYHNIGATVTLKLSKGAFVFAFANDTEKNNNAITMLYTKAY